MKTTLILSALMIFATITGMTQDKLKDVKARVGNPEILKNWSVGQEKELDGVKMLRTSGDNTIAGRTNVFYTPNENMLAAETKAAAGNISPETSGGQLHLFFDRESESLASAELFKLTVLNLQENEILFQSQLPKETPHPYIQGIWYNYVSINIPDLEANNFFVKIDDSGLNQSFSFKVSVTESLEKIVKPQPAQVTTSK